MVGRPTGAGALDRDDPEAPLQRDLVHRRRHLEAGPRRAVEPQHDVAVGVAELGPAELTTLGDHGGADRARRPGGRRASASSVPLCGCPLGHLLPRSVARAGDPGPAATPAG